MASERKINDEKYKKCIELHLKGYSLRKIELELDAPRNMVSMMLKKDGYIERTKHKDEDSIIEDTIKGSTIEQILSKYTINKAQLKELRFFNNLTQEQERYNLDFNCLREDSEFKYYVLGYIFSDGCIDDTQIRFGCQKSDDDILIKINDVICLSEHKIKKISYANNAAFLRYDSREIVNYLKSEYGLHDSKSLTLKFPSNIPEQYMKDFLRGQFDGDGGIHESGVVSMSGTYDIVDNFVKEIRKYVDIQYKSTIREQVGCFQVRFTSRQDALRILSFLYKDSSIFLDRKYNIYKIFKEKHNL